MTPASVHVLDAIAEQRQREAARNEAAVPVFDPRPYTWKDRRTIPPREWVYDRHYIRRFVSVTVAPGGVGKSSLEIVEALVMATGRPLLGIAPNERARVWLWNGEDPEDELDRRIQAALDHYGITAEEIDGWLFVNSGRDLPLVIAEQTRDGTKIFRPQVDAMKAAIKRLGIGVVMLDPFVSCHRVTENDNNAIERVVKECAGIAEETRCAFELVHHCRKTAGEVTVEDGRGASALLAAARSARVCNVMSKDEGERAGVKSHRAHFKIENGKSNLAPPPETAQWRRFISFDLGNETDTRPSDQVGVVERWKWPAPLDGFMLQDLQRVQAAVSKGRFKASPQADAWVGKEIARVLGLDLESKRDIERVKGALGAWVKSGALRVVEMHDPDSRKDRPFVVVGELAA